MSKRSASKLSEYDRGLIIGYLYGQLDESELATFHTKRNNDPEFASVLKQQEELDLLIPKSENLELDEEYQTAQRWQLNKSLRKSKQSRFELAHLLRSIFDTQVTFKAQFASMIVAFALGILLSNQLPKLNQNTMGDEISNVAEHASTNNATRVSRELFSDYEVVDFELEDYNLENGTVKVSYALGSKNTIKGQVDDPAISYLFTQAMKTQYINDATRLNLVALLNKKRTSTPVQQTLQYSLLNDPNPGVRIAAAEALAKLAGDKEIRDTLREALQSDVNQGIRVTAFQALINHLEDKETLRLLKSHSVTDSNNFIRETSKKLTQSKTSI